MALTAATAGTWGIGGPTFLLTYLLIAVAVGLAGRRVRRTLAEPGTTSPIRELPERPHDVAHLAGGGELAVWSALCAMHVRGTITASDGTVRATGRLDPDADPLERAVHAVAASGAARRRLVFHRSVQAVLADTEDRLVTGGFLLSDHRRRQIRRVGVAMLAVAGLGLVRVLAEVAEARPVGLLVPVLLAVTVVAVVQLVRSPRRTRHGDRALAALRAEHAALAPEREPDWRAHGPARAALAVGLFGAGALVSAAPGFARVLEPRQAAPTAAEESGLAVNGGGDGGQRWGLRG